MLGRRRGFLAGLMGLIGAVGAIVGGVWASREWAPVLYQKYLGAAIGEKVAAAVAEQGANAPALLEKYMGFLPEDLQQKLAAAVQAAVSGADTDIAAQVVTALQPLLEPVLQTLIFLVACMVIRALFSFLVKLMRAFNGLPVLGTLNRILGFAFGFVTGVLDCWLICLVLWAVASASAGRIPFLTTASLSQSVIYTFFLQFNPFLVHY